MDVGDYQSRRIRSMYAAGGFFLRKKGFPRAPFQRKPLLRRPPRGERGGRRRDGWGVGDYQSRRIWGMYAAGEFFLRKKGFPRTPFQRKPLMRRPPRKGRDGRRGDGWSVGDYQSRRIRSMYAAGEFFLRKKSFPRAPFQRKPLLRRPPRGGRGGRREDGWSVGDYQSRRIRSMYAAVPIQIVRSVLWVSL